MGRENRGPASRFRRWLAISTAATALLAFTSAGAAQATPTGFSGASGQHGAGCYVNMADNGSNTWFGYYLDSQTVSAMHWALSYIENETDIDEVGVSTHDGNTDIIYNDGHYFTQSGPPCVPNSSWYPNGGTIGYTVCWSLTSNNRCQQHRIYIGTEWEEASAQTAGWDQALLLHESGHQFGLTHSSQDPKEVMSPEIIKLDYYSVRDKDLINSNY